MDWISSAAGLCIVPVPPGANFATIRVSQTNFVENVLTLSQLDGTDTEVKRTLCGGQHSFSGQVPQSEQCSTFLPCGGGFFGTVSSIRFDVPAAVGNSKTCRAAFAATIDFQFINRTSSPEPQNCPFQCKGDLSCLALSAICNSVVDCKDGSDEEKCRSWAQIESDYIFPTAADASLRRINVFAECRTAALLNGTKLFAVAKNQTLCILYKTSRVKEYLMNPTPYIQAAPGFAMFATLDEW
jgi:hypothetical protein